MQDLSSSSAGDKLLSLMKSAKRWLWNQLWLPSGELLRESAMLRMVLPPWIQFYPKGGKSRKEKELPFLQRFVSNTGKSGKRGRTRCWKAWVLGAFDYVEKSKMSSSTNFGCG